MPQIKTLDLCRRCEYFYGRECNTKGCDACVMRVPKNGFCACKCNEIEFNTPCPHFKEAEDDENA